MLPLLPALILLLLHGPSNIETLSHNGGLPRALHAVQRPDSAPVLQRAKADEYALASLLRLSGDPQFSSALSALLVMRSEEVEASFGPVVAEPHGTNFPAPFDGKLREGFDRSQRSRDGPVLGC